MEHPMGPGLALAWLVAMGADEPVADFPDAIASKASLPDVSSWLRPAIQAAQSRGTTRAPTAATVPASPAASRAQAVAEAAGSLAELAEALRSYDGLALRNTATNLVFADGDPTASLMVIGEAPGAEEDRAGKPFVGRSGQLLDRMLASVGFSRAPTGDQVGCYITNLVAWRPPGNRTPTDAELAQSLPFCLRHIALVRPRMILLAGGVSAKALTGRQEGVLRLRGKWFEIEAPGMQAPVPALVTLHPAYLLRSPGAKREVWADMLALRRHWAHAMECSAAAS
jgi:uracil-DNA glycosylase